MTEAVVTQSVPEVSPPYFAVSATKLVVMCFFTLGIYCIYWFYMQWRLIKERERSDIIPAMRSIFQIFFCYSLIQHVNATAQSNHVDGQLPAGFLATGFIILSLLSRLPDPYWPISFLFIGTLVPVQNLMNRVNIQLVPHATRNERFSGANIAFVIIGGLVLVLALIGTFLPEK